MKKKWAYGTGWLIFIMAMAAILLWEAASNKILDLVNIISLAGTVCVACVPVCLCILLSTKTSVTDSVNKMDAATKAVMVSALAVVWFVAAVGTRVIYMVLRPMGIKDGAGYFADAMIRQGEVRTEITSGLSYAYTQNLSELFRFLGNRIGAVVIYQLVLQVIAMILIAISIIWLWGRSAALVTGGILVFSSGYYMAAWNISPDIYLMLHFGLLLMMIGYFKKKTREKGYTGYMMGIFLLLTGFYMGIICIWDVKGFILLLVILGVLLGNGYRAGKEEHCKRKLYPFIQTLIMVTGTAAGALCIMIRYAGITQNTMIEQFHKWMTHYGKLEFSNTFLYNGPWLILLFAAAAGMGAQLILNKSFESEEKQGAEPEIVTQLIKSESEAKTELKQKAADMETELKQELTEAKTELEQKAALEKSKLKQEEAYAGKQMKLMAHEKSESIQEEDLKENEVMTPDGRKITLLHNPLPVPKKHISKEMEFDIKGKSDEFDHPVLENDDFDL